MSDPYTKQKPSGGWRNGGLGGSAYWVAPMYFRLPCRMSCTAAKYGGRNIPLLEALPPLGANSEHHSRTRTCASDSRSLCSSHGAPGAAAPGARFRCIS